jgi:hypothetical protein
MNWSQSEIELATKQKRTGHKATLNLSQSKIELVTKQK